MHAVWNHYRGLLSLEAALPALQPCQQAGNQPVRINQHRVNGVKVDTAIYIGSGSGPVFRKQPGSLAAPEIGGLEG